MNEKMRHESNQMGKFLQNNLISFFAIPIDFAFLIILGALFQSLVASPIKNVIEPL